ncbi:MAG: DUF3019 domain-containing protein [Gammaproteobacteria bacterium]|nr:DUF3019 domain-containing protein [Gammaproteobacteria bacterium]
MMRRFALSLLAIVITATAQAEEMKLSVKPLLCITDSRNAVCEMSFLVVWESGESGYYCLFSDYHKAPLRCWTEEREGRLNDDRAVRETFSFWMTGTDTAARLAEVRVEVLRMDSDDRRRNRRTRHVWDIN